MNRSKKISRHIPPKSSRLQPQIPSRCDRHKVVKRIIVENITKFIPREWRDNYASHIWTVYVRGSKENLLIDDFVAIIRFFFFIIGKNIIHNLKLNRTFMHLRTSD